MKNHEHGINPLERRSKIVWIIFAAIAAFYLWTEHRAHLLGVLPLLLLLACPLMHLFMHHGHRHDGGDQGHQDKGGQ
jgi:hypothetical protein